MSTDVIVTSANSPYDVSSGQTDTGDVVSSGGSMYVLDSGTAIDTTVDSGGYEQVESGGVDSGALISGGEQDVYGSAVGATLFTFGSQVVESGGIASATIVNNGGEQDVWGTASGTIVSGGQMYVEVGGTAISAIVSSAGNDEVQGTAIGTTLEGGFESVDGIASGTIVSNGGEQLVGGAGIASGTTVSSGGFVLDAGTTTGTILAGGNEGVYGRASGTTISSSGTEYVYSGGRAVGATVFTGSQVVESGGTASATIVRGGQLDVLSGGLADSATIYHGGLEVISSGGTDSGAKISGGNQDVYGSAVGATVFTGSQVVESGGIASATIVSNGGQEDVYGTASGIIVRNGGRENVYGTASGTIVSSGGNEGVYGTATGTILAGGDEGVYGTATGTTISSSGSIEYVLSGGSAVGATVFTGSQVVESGGTASDTTVSSGGTLYVSSGGLADPATIYSGGLEVVSSGGTDSGAQISGGEQDVYGSAISATIFAGYQYVYGGTASDTTINSGGVQVVDTTADDTTINSGGQQFVFSGTAIGTVVSSGGYEYVESGGTDSGAQILGGVQDVYGSAVGATVFTGSQVVESGGTASGTIVTAGAYTYTTVDDPSDPNGTYAVGLDNAGELLGYYNNGSYNAFTYQNGTYASADNPYASGDGTYPYAINHAGEIVGHYYGAADNDWGVYTAYADNNGAFSELNPLAGQGSYFYSSDAFGINGLGEIVGAYSNDDGGGFGFLYNPANGSYTTLTYAPHAINDAGDAVGSYNTGSGYDGFLYSNGNYSTATTLIAPNSVDTYAVAINSSDDIVGYSTDSSGANHGFIYDGGVYTILNAPGAIDTVATAINDGGTVAGYYVDSASDVHGFVYSNGTFTTVDDPSATSGTILVAINDAGQVAGDYADASGQHAFVTDRGTEIVTSGGTAVDTVVSSGGILIVSSGGLADPTTIYAGGLEVISAGGADSGALISGGEQDVYGSAIGATVFAGGSQVVESGGIASNTITSGGTVEVVSGGTIGSAVTFASDSGTLQIDGPNAAGALLAGATISGFVPGDTVDLTGISYDSGGSANLDPATNELAITENGQTYDLQLNPSQDFAGDYFHLSADAGTGTDIAESNTPCYCRGTLIRTGRAQKRVENLKIGDKVKTLSGALRPIRWIGRRGYDGRFADGQRHILPICIKAGALDENVPRRDLWISPHHAMYLEGVLIEARDLVNGVSIVQAERVDKVEYFHIELDSHDVIIAEGALSETFIDDHSRGMFHNAHEYRALYPDVAAAPAHYCAPRLYGGDQVEAARGHIARRAGVPYVPTERQIAAAQASVPRALVVDSTYPRIGHDGGANAILDHVRALQAAGFAVSFLALRDRQGDSSALVSLGAAPLRLAHDVTLEDVFRRQPFDLIYLHRLENAAACLDAARRHGGAQIVYSVADLHHLRLKGQSAVEQQPARAQELAQQALKLGLMELSLAAAADSVITHSITEAEWLRRAPGLRGTGKVHVVPWSIPAQPIRRPFSERSGIVFSGGFGHQPNVDAARWLVEAVMPLVRSQAPEITCFLAGTDMPDEVLALHQPGVEVLGRVEHLRELFERVRLTVAPLRFGAGVKDKVVRSLGAGLPCVGTLSAFDGLPQLPAVLLRHCLRKTARGLAEAMVAMHRDEAINTRCAQAGFGYVDANFNASGIDALIEEIAQPARDRHRARRISVGDSQGRAGSDVAISLQVKIVSFGGADGPAVTHPAKSAASADTGTPAILDVNFTDQPRERRRAI